MDHRLSGIASWPPSILQKINATQERRCRPESDRRLAINDGCACLAKQRDKPSRPVPANTPRRTGLIYCWSSIVDSGPALSQHLFMSLFVGFPSLSQHYLHPQYHTLHKKMQFHPLLGSRDLRLS